MRMRAKPTFRFTIDHILPIIENRDFPINASSIIREWFELKLREI